MNPEPSTSTSSLNELVEIENINEENVQNLLIPPGYVPRRGEPIKQVRLHN